MPVAIHPDETFEYQLIDDRLPDANGERTEKSAPDPSGTFFKLSALRPRDEASIEDACIGYSKRSDGVGLEVSSARLGVRSLEILLKTLRGWRNFRDARGAEVPWAGFGSEENLARISAAHRHELSGAAVARSRVTVPESD